MRIRMDIKSSLQVYIFNAALIFSFRSRIESLIVRSFGFDIFNRQPLGNTVHPRYQYARIIPDNGAPIEYLESILSKLSSIPSTSPR